MGKKKKNPLDEYEERRRLLETPFPVKLSIPCECPYPNECSECGGSGRLITDAGRELLEFLEAYGIVPKENDE